MLERMNRALRKAERVRNVIGWSPERPDRENELIVRMEGLINLLEAMTEAVADADFELSDEPAWREGMHMMRRQAPRWPTEVQ